MKRINSLTFVTILVFLISLPVWSANNVSTTPFETDTNHINYFLLSIEFPLSTDASVDYFTRDETAIAGLDKDYISTSGTAIIKAGETSTLIAIEIVGDTVVEATESFFLVIHNPKGASFPLGALEIAVRRTIIDDDVETVVMNNQSTGDPNFISDHFIGSGNCQTCHNGLSNNQGKDVSIVNAWQSSIMANSTRDPFWKAKFRSELYRTPSLSEVINDKCTRCHAPMASVKASVNQFSLTAFDGGFFSSSNSNHSLAMEGVSCTLCHQIIDSTALGTQDGFSGHYEMNTNVSGIDRKLYGPYQNITTRPMQNFVDFTPEYSEHITESKFCATCHNLKTPYTDENGNILSTTKASEFPEQMPYSEWLHSDYVSGTETIEIRSCQDCHMTRSDGVRISSRPMNLQTRDNFAEHNFIGANLFMLNILNDYKTELGVIATDFSRTLSETQLLLESSASIQLMTQKIDTNGLSFTIKVTSDTGHKLPSAYPSRRIIVHVKIEDAMGQLVFESGGVNENGSIQGLDSDQDLKQYESHYDQISNGNQVQVYEAIMQDHQEKVTYTLLRAKEYIKDNRILPPGFDKDTAESDIKVIGNALNDTNFKGGSDEVSYLLSELQDESYSITVELVYQTLAYGFALDLFQDDLADVNQFKQMYASSTHKSHVIDSLNFVISK